MKAETQAEQNRNTEAKKISQAYVRQTMRGLAIEANLLYIKAHVRKKHGFSTWAQDWQNYMFACQKVTVYETRKGGLVRRETWQGEHVCADCECRNGMLHAIGCDTEQLNGKHVFGNDDLILDYV